MNRGKFIGLKAAELNSIRDQVPELKRLVVKMFQAHCCNGLFTLNFHLLDHLTEDIECFGSIEMLEASPTER